MLPGLVQVIFVTWLSICTPLPQSGDVVAAESHFVHKLSLYQRKLRAELDFARRGGACCFEIVAGFKHAAFPVSCIRALGDLGCSSDALASRVRVKREVGDAWNGLR